MWLCVFFDLPVDTKAARRAYAQFRKFLLRDGFLQLQYSVYGRVCPTEDTAAAHIQRIQDALPPDGEVRILKITDKQFQRQRIFLGKMRCQPPKPPEQLEFF